MLNEYLNRINFWQEENQSPMQLVFNHSVDADNYVGKSLINAIFEAEKTKERFILLI